jgi:hypothetical protein
MDIYNSHGYLQFTWIFTIHMDIYNSHEYLQFTWIFTIHMDIGCCVSEISLSSSSNKQIAFL